MASIEDINKLLGSCAAELDRCAGLIRDAELAPVKENIRRIGHALYNIFEIQNEIFKLQPELMPKGWNEPVTDKELNRVFGELLERNRGQITVSANIGAAHSEPDFLVIAIRRKQ